MKRGRILLVTINYWPEVSGIGKYTGEMAEWLVRRGVEVRVITAPPYYPVWRINKGYSGWRYRGEEMAGVEIVRCPLWVPRRPMGLKRIVHLASFAATALPVMLWSGWRWRPDVVLVIEPPLFCAPGALLAAWLGRSRTWLHVQDFEVDAAFDLGILRAARLRRWVLAAEAWLMRRFDRVTTISERMVERLESKGVAAKKRGLFPNWVDLERIRPMGVVSPLRAEWGLKDSDLVVLYSGSMGEKQGLELICEVAQRVPASAGIVFLLCGDGPARPRLEQLALSVATIRFKPLQPLERLNDLLSLADIHVLPQRAEAADLVLPSKLTNMLASGRPVVATAAAGTQVAELVCECGVVVRPGDSVGLAAALTWLAESADRRRELGLKGRVLAARLWDKERLLSEAFFARSDYAPRGELADRE